MAAELSTCTVGQKGLLGRKGPKWSIAAAKQFTQVPDDSPPSGPRNRGEFPCAATAVTEAEMQHGSLALVSRKEGPAVWQFRWSEKDLHGARVQRKRVIGTVERNFAKSAKSRVGRRPRHFVLDRAFAPIVGHPPTSDLRLS
jgi:hypothetical protein